jgi:hypothetical protein
VAAGAEPRDSTSVTKHEGIESRADGGEYHAVALVCTECNQQSSRRALHWRSYRTDDPTEDEPPGLAFYCPTCAEREFGDIRPDSEYRWFQS